ncbi:U3 small nucleolar ribonucleoprotein [Babesia ovis]|uniref:U3 small nucleolar ribonucleoprotein n=1 Tax=Babesia ovis TaxID=5869 RepID=A0A9W5WVS7_BABOV|nr:U3 small nucleolar ribonucleoprotein [Babesia ovis]
MTAADSDAGDSTKCTVSADRLIQQPWTLWDKKPQCEALLKDKLLTYFKGVVLIKRRRTHIADEISKKRSRRTSAIRRAIAVAKTDAKKAYNSATSLGLEELWTYLESEIAGDIELLTERLKACLVAQPNRILKQKQGSKGVPTESLSYASGHYEEEDVVIHDQKTRHRSLSKSKGNDIAYHTSDKEDDNYGGDYSDLSSEKCLEGTDDEIYATDDEHDDELEAIEAGTGSYHKNEEEVVEMGKQKKVTNDPFFKMEEMEEFADRDFDDDGDFNYFESLGEESDTSTAAVDMMYDDFFKEPDEVEEEGEALHCSRNLEGLDEDEREMELLLQKVEDGAESDEDDSERDEADLVDFDHLPHVEEEEQKTEADENSDQISQLEKDLIAQKHWSLMGEATARKRPRNSLLDLDLELPQNFSFIHADNAGDVDGTPEDDNMGSEENKDVPIEIIIQQRIKAEVFDNVERKVALEDQLEAIEKLKRRRNKMDSDAVEIDFNKSKMGLGDVYAKRYQEMFMATDQLDSHKQKLTDDFGKLMFKLDSLCNYHMVPKRVSEAEKTKDVASITVEAPINVVTASRHTDGHDKMEGNRLTRNAKKRKFTNKLKALLKSGQATVEEINKIKQSMMERNRQRIQDARSIKATGQTKDQGLKEKRSNRRVNIAELMARGN